MMFAIVCVGSVAFAINADDISICQVVQVPLYRGAILEERHYRIRLDFALSFDPMLLMQHSSPRRGNAEAYVCAV